MKKLTTLLMTLVLLCTMAWADQTVTVSANSSDISEGLDLKVVAKLFAEAKNLEEFESMLNNPDSAFCNLDLNGDGQVDYLRVVETGEGNKRLIVLQAILAKDIYQDVASIYVEKDEKEQVSVQIVGDEYVYGTNYIIEPVYVYRPVIYDWFWCSSWYAWHSPWYWGYWPGWWYAHDCWAHDWYWHHCYAFHHHHHYCSFRPGRTIHHGYHDLHRGVTRRDYAVAHPDRTFTKRNSGMTNAREIRKSNDVRTRQANTAVTASGRQSAGVTERSANANSRTYGSRNTAATRSANAATATTRSANTATATTRSANTATATTRSANATTATTRSARTTTRSADATRSASAISTRTITAPSRSSITTTSGNAGATTRSANATTATTRSANTTTRSASTYSGSSARSSSSFSGSSRSASSFSGGSSRSSGFSGGGGRSVSGGASTRR